MSKEPKVLNVNLVTCPAMLLELEADDELEIIKGLGLGTITKGAEEGNDDA
jgi:hypothetical protein